MNLNERINQLMAENERLKAELATANSMHVDAVRFIWEERGFGSCAEMAEKFDALKAKALALEIAGELMASDLVDSTEFFSLKSIAAFDDAKVLPPQHHLADHDAEVAKAAFIAGVDARRIALLNDEQAAIKSDQYAAQLRTKAGA